MNKKIKNVVILLCCILFGFIIGACGSTTMASEDKPLKLYFENDATNSISTYKLVDDDTGVNYVVVDKSLSRGAGISICPRYNADGSLYVSE